MSEVNAMPLAKRRELTARANSGPGVTLDGIPAQIVGVAEDRATVRTLMGYTPVRAWFDWRAVERALINGGRFRT